MSPVLSAQTLHVPPETLVPCTQLSPALTAVLPAASHAPLLLQQELLNNLEERMKKVMEPFRAPAEARAAGSQ